ncbi:MAG TPA: nucleotide excision repair endonuclease, partial [Propionibacteriaceae bacterium]|nr:nucleotide excision repair endonuclease [Propionibacteriaceae bacterium]
MTARPEAVALLPHEPGVYRFRDDRGRALYVGRAGDLRRRVGSYWGDLRGRRHLRRMVPQIARLEALVCCSEHEAAWVERMLLESAMPRWNRVAGGMEVDVHIVLDEGRRSLRLSHDAVVGARVRCYGPYLGGTATRLAVAALHRLYSLSYTESGLTGTERELARVRGAAGTDGGDVAARIHEVLSRDAVAVAAARDVLIARRDAAAAAERYETAAAIQAELGGFDWVVAPVRFVGTPDLDLSWSEEGQRLALRLRGVRLERWKQEACPRDGI